MHSHLIPGIDDGAKTLEDSLHLIRRLKSLGYQKLITTPHIMSEYFPNTPERIRAGLAKVKAALEEAQIDIELEAAAEYYLDDVFMRQLREKAPLMTFGDRYILVELSTFSESINVKEIIFQLKTQGYRPILAHPERYPYYASRIKEFYQIKEMGCQLQANLLSLNGHYGVGPKKMAISLLEADLIDYLGTDLHREKHLDKINSLFQDRRVAKLLKKKHFCNEQL